MIRRTGSVYAIAAWWALTAGGALMIFASRAAAADPEPLPSGMEALGSASRGDVVRALRKVRHHYGDDAIVIETQLLVNAMRNGSMRATAVSVDGVRSHEDKRYLVFVVDTGVVFDSTTRDETTRVHVLWETIMVPMLERLQLQGLRVPADGIKVAMRYHHRPYRTLDELRAHLDQPGTPEETDFYVLGPDVDALIGRSETPHTLLARAHVTVDGAARAVAVAPADLRTAPGPD
ncbi:MAG: hypothetical protein HY271_11130 [Deltaproteobacteria bacterium]|nr:hypothetical protein [Deltaproteobacteria bacterium]